MSPSTTHTTHSVLDGLFSTATAKASLTVVGFAVTTALARSLNPADFGLIGMATVLTALLSMLGSLGFDSAIVQYRTLSDKHLSTLYWVKIAVGILSCLALYLTAPLVSGMYAEPRLTEIIRWLSVVFLISATCQTHRSLLRRQMRFRVLSVITIVSVVLSGTIAIALALLGAGVWSLVAQAISLEAVAAILYWRMAKWRPDASIALADTLPLLRFGAAMGGANLMLYLQRHIDALLIGAFLGATALGYYALAYRIMYAPVRQIAYLFGDVLYPALSGVQDDLNTVRSWYLRAIHCVALLTFPLMTFVTLYSERIVYVLFGARWSAAAAVVSMLAPAGALQGITHLTYVVFPVVGRPLLCMMQYVFAIGFLVLGIVVGARWGVEGAACGVLVSTIAAFIVAQCTLHRVVLLRMSNVVRALRSSGLGSAAMGFVVFLLPSSSLADNASVSQLAARAVLCVMVLAGVIVLTDWKTLASARDMLAGYWSRLKCSDAQMVAGKRCAEEDKSHV